MGEKMSKPDTIRATVEGLAQLLPSTQDQSHLEQCSAHMLALLGRAEAAEARLASIEAETLERAATLVERSQVAYHGDNTIVEPARDPGASPSHNALAAAIRAMKPA